MANWSAPVQVRIADLPQMQRFITAAAAVSAALAGCDDLPEQVHAAAGELRAALAGLGVTDEPAPSDEDRIRDAMAEAQDHPGRAVTR